MTKVYFSEIMPNNFFELCVNSDVNVHLVPAGTGVGKSHFIMNNIVAQAHKKPVGFGDVGGLADKKIVIAVNRTALKKKTRNDYAKLKQQLALLGNTNVHIVSYQAMTQENKTVEDIIKAYKDCDILIADEAHYFVADAWNGTTMRLFNAVTQLADQGMKLIMFTATPKKILNFLRYTGIVTNIHEQASDVNWNHRIDFIATNKSVEQITKQIKEQSNGYDKSMVYVPEKTARGRIEQKATTLENHLEQETNFYYSSWITSKFTDFFHKDRLMSEKHDYLIEKEMFDETLAICNKAIDNGINVKDPRLKHIILCNQYDQTQIIQMIGRKRFDPDDENDRLTVWCTNEGNNILLEQKRN